MCRSPGSLAPQGVLGGGEVYIRVYRRYEKSTKGIQKGCTGSCVGPPGQMVLKVFWGVTVEYLRSI